MLIPDPYNFYRKHLQRLDLLLHRQILRLRQAYRLSLDEFRGLYVSDAQVDDLVNQAAAKGNAHPSIEALTRQAADLKSQMDAENSRDDFPWRQMKEIFSLSSFEQDILLLALAPELDLKYEIIYAYLNNDVNRKWPTFDTILRIFSEDLSRGTAQQALLDNSTLLLNGIIKKLPAPSGSPHWLSTGVTLSEITRNYLLGLGLSDATVPGEIISWVDTGTHDNNVIIKTLEEKDPLQTVDAFFQDSFPGNPPLFLLTGKAGAGRFAACCALFRRLGLPLIKIHGSAFSTGKFTEYRFAGKLTLLHRLSQCGVYISEADALFDREYRPLTGARGMIQTLSRLGGPVFMASESIRGWEGLMKDMNYYPVHFAMPDFAWREKLWAQAVTETGADAGSEDIAALSSRFRLTHGQIKNAVRFAYNSSLMADGRTDLLGSEKLFSAARIQSTGGLNELAVKVACIYKWKDLVLPKVTLNRIKAVADAVKHRHIVYGTWDFSKRLSSGKGLMTLFSGVSGTGKTMAASVLAGELGLDLFKIDLSRVVSKYIGETEKNLDTIFSAAEDSNAVLFFDEADALFGKRSEVKDAHDRYANIEVAYLLQKMEEYDGIVILSTNLNRNIDKAFSRRMHFTVEFPLPDEGHRRKIWEGMFPEKAPLGNDVDFDFLARQFSISGGEIRNVALDAAFQAAGDGRIITMEMLITAMARQMIKQGKVISSSHFKKYHHVVMPHN